MTVVPRPGASITDATAGTPLPASPAMEVAAAPTVVTVLPAITTTGVTGVVVDGAAGVDGATATG
ncbi:MAG: hypothetical protein JO368_06075 [Acidimicrobiales bacterium]|nr:hypothetical protein [Acidimicrobiales bacterium]